MDRSLVANLRRASTAIFLVHLVRTVLACFVTAPLWPLLDLRGADDATLTAYALELLPSALPLLLIGLLAHALLAPYLHQLVLAAMRGLALREAARRSALMYLPALALTLLRWLALLAVVAAAYFLLASSPNALSLALTLVFGLPALLAIATAHDLAAGRLSLPAQHEHARVASVLGAVLRPNAGALAAHVLFILLGAGIGLGSELLARSSLLELSGPAVVLLLQQALALLATLVRAAWLSASATLAARARGPAFLESSGRQAAEI